MKSYITFTRKKLLVLTFVLLVFLLICNQLYLAGNKENNALTNAMRLNFLNTMGYKVVSDTPTVKNVALPEVFSEVYVNYNNLQKSAGYDLSLYKGCKVTIYSYCINTPGGYKGEFYANMIVYNNRIIGGDVSSSVFGGTVLPLKSCN